MAIPLDFPYETWGKRASQRRALSYATAGANPYEKYGLCTLFFARTDTLVLRESRAALALHTGTTQHRRCLASPLWVQWCSIIYDSKLIH